jgi:hypothetical protein
MKIFLAFIIFWFHNFDLFQGKVQLIFKFEVDYIVFSSYFELQTMEKSQYTLRFWMLYIIVRSL